MKTIKQSLIEEAKLLSEDHPSKDCRSFARDVFIYLTEPVRTMSGELSPNTERKPTNSEILELASREDAYPCNPFWLKDEVPVGDVQAAAVKFARAVIDRFGRKES